MREYRRINYERERIRLNASNRKIKLKKKQIVREAKEKPCADCGIQYPYYIMDFDHKGDKKFNLNRAQQYTFEQILAEIAKCDVVCANCHRERTALRRLV